MDDAIRKMLLRCSRIDFGSVPLSKAEGAFRAEMNDEILSLCSSLPPSVQTEALLFLARHLHSPIENGSDFFRYYHPPTWSIIYWLAQCRCGEGPLDKTVIRNARTGHAMAMLLHALDDHLNDGDLMPTHLALLIRSQAWMIMNRAFAVLAAGVKGGSEIARNFIDAYYSSVTGVRDVENLKAYCDRFKDQMAMGFVAPVLMTRLLNATEEFTVDIEHAYASFGIAWRLMDDFKDLKDDMSSGARSSFYFCLPDSLKLQWDETRTNERGPDSETAIFTHIVENGIQDGILLNVRNRLLASVSLFGKHRMKGLARECACLWKPLETLCCRK